MPVGPCVVDEVDVAVGVVPLDCVDVGVVPGSVVSSGVWSGAPVPAGSDVGVDVATTLGWGVGVGVSALPLHPIEATTNVAVIMNIQAMNAIFVVFFIWQT